MKLKKKETQFLSFCVWLNKLRGHGRRIFVENWPKNWPGKLSRYQREHETWNHRERNIFLSLLVARLTHSTPQQDIKIDLLLSIYTVIVHLYHLAFMSTRCVARCKRNLCNIQPWDKKKNVGKEGKGNFCLLLSARFDSVFCKISKRLDAKEEKIPAETKSKCFNFMMFNLLLVLDWNCVTKWI